MKYWFTDCNFFIEGNLVMKKSVVLTVFLAVIAIQPVQAKWGG